MVRESGREGKRETETDRQTDRQTKTDSRTDRERESIGNDIHREGKTDLYKSVGQSGWRWLRERATE